MRVIAMFAALLIVWGAATAAAQDKPVGAPLEIFERLWADFDDRYAFFDLKATSWKQLHDTYRARINADTPSGQLFDVSCAMLRELNDGHVSLSDPATGRSCRSGSPVRLVQEFPSQEALRALVKAIDAQLAANGFAELTRIKMDVPYLSGHVIEYTTGAGYGYLRINLMYGLPEEQFVAAIDAAIEALKEVRGVIVDVRFNSGGFDTYAYALAGRFADTKRLGHYKSTKTRAGFSALEPWYVAPAGARQLARPVVLLTSSLSQSAADVFALAMRQLPHVTIVGENTRGIFSDMYDGQLPNGWEYTLSHQKYLSPDKQNLEGTGVAPDARVVNTKDDLKTGADPVLSTAIGLLRQKLGR